MTPEAVPRCEFESSQLILKLNMTLAADVNAVDPVVSGIMEIVRQMHCSKGKEFEVETALREALANAIVHGARRDPSKQIECCVACDEQRGMLILVRDPGSGFDPAQLPSPVHGQNLYSEGGRGIFLINQLMDEVRFERGGTEIFMRKYGAA